MPKWLIVTNGVLSSLLLLSLLLILWLGALDFRKKEPEVLSLIRDTHSGLNETFDNLNRPCGSNKPCGTIADVNQTLGTIRGTFGQVEIAARNINKNQGVFFGQETRLYTHTDAILTGFQGTISRTNNAIDEFTGVETGFLGVEDQFSHELTDFQKTNTDINTYLESNEFKGTMTNMNDVSGSLKLVSTDIATKTHEFLYPPPCKGSLCWLKRTYEVTKDIGPLAEPFYYGISTYESLRHSQPY